MVAVTIIAGFFLARNMMVHFTFIARAASAFFKLSKNLGGGRTRFRVGADKQLVKQGIGDRRRFVSGYGAVSFRSQKSACIRNP